jgi:Fur family transcriptional regulator, ferric uptake regulator
LSHHTHLIEDIRQRGYRMTPQRDMILEAIHASGHMTADEIYQQVHVKSPAVNLATVYRTLELLKALHLVSAIDTGEGCVHYELAGEQPHHHLVCEACGEAVELDCDVLLPLEQELCKRYGFQMNLNHLALFGLCPKCQKPKRKRGG